LENTAVQVKKESKVKKFFAKFKQAKFHKPYFAIPYGVLITIFIVVPLGIVLVRSFMSDVDGSFTFGNYAYFFGNPYILRTLGNSILIALLTTIGCLLLTYPIALILSNSNFNKSMILVLLFVLPMYINFMLRTFAMRSVLDLLGIGTVDRTPANQLFRIVVAHIYDFFPFMLLPIYTCMVNIDKSYIEASKDLGASSWKSFWKVTFPLSLPGVLSGVLMVFMPTLSMFAVRDLINTGNEWLMVGNQIFSMFHGGAGARRNIGAAFSMILLILVAAVMIVANRLNALKNKKLGEGGKKV